MEEIVSSLFPAGVGVAIGKPTMGQDSLWPCEKEYVKNAVFSRRQEFARGRGAARLALAQLGCPKVAIAARPDRTPIWPDGYVGSISHCNGFCGAVVCKIADLSAIGFDAEVLSSSTTEIDSLMFSREERSHFSTLPALHNWRIIAFSAKEAFYKFYYPKSGHRLTFLDIGITFSMESSLLRGAFEVYPCNSNLSVLGHHGNWALHNGLVFSGSYSV